MHSHQSKKLSLSQGFVLHCKAMMTGLCLIVFCFAGIVCHAQVKAAFSVNTYSGCVPLTIQCNGSENGSNTNLLWTSSDGQTSGEQNPSFVFTQPGTYLLKLKVSNSTVADSTWVTIVAHGISASFTYSYNNICTTPVPVQFTASSLVSSGNYHWDFGDNTVSIVSTPKHVYNAQGSYTVRLTTYSAEGCIDSSQKTLQTGSVAVDFEAPPTICNNNPVLFKNTSSSLPKSLAWTVNGTVVNSNSFHLLQTFSTPGTYTIQLSEDFGGCKFQKQKTITVLPSPVASFTQSGILQSCSYPSTVQFTNASQNADNYVWNFGDSANSQDANPAHTYTRKGQYSPMLIAYSANGCADTVTKANLIFLGPPTIKSISPLPFSGCLPYKFSPKANIATPEPIASYNWNFGNGIRSADSVPSNTYTKGGTYNVTLTIQTVSGCTDTLIVKNAVTVGDSIVPDFTVDKNIGCSSDTFHFKGTSSKPAYSWLWYFGDGNVAGGQNATYTYRSSGYETVSLAIGNNGCVVTTSKKNFVMVKPPVSYISVKYDCTNQLNVRLLDSSQGPLTWLWNFGDGATSTQQNPPLHTYPASGIYTVKLTTTNGECSSTKNVTVPIINTKPIFTFSSVSTTLCRKQGVWMSATNPEYIADYYWNFDDGRSAFSDTAIYNFYNTPGTYHPSLITKYKNGCYDTIYSPTPVIINGPTAAFTVTGGSTCLGKTTQFIDKSKSDGTHKLVNWWWSCGDGFTAKANSDSPFFSHLYVRSGNYAASLMIKDENNCADTAYYTVKINALPNVFVVKDTFVCDGNSVTLKAAGAVNYVWNADATLSCSECDSTVALPQEESKVYVVTGTDANQCAASAIAHVQVVRPFNMSVSSTTSEICQQQTTTLTATGADMYSWQPSANLSDATAANPIAAPDVTTQYFVVGTDAHNCFSQRGDIIILVHPKPDFAIQDSLIVAQKGDVHVITTTGSDNITSWLWTPSYGLSCNNCAQPVLTALKTITYMGIASTDYGCTDTSTIKVHVLCNGSKIYIPSGFSPNHDGKNDWFYVVSSIDNPIRSMIIYSRNGDHVFAKTNFFTNNATQGWDGNVNGLPASEGVYVYRIEILCNDEVVPLTGTITLLR